MLGRFSAAPNTVCRSFSTAACLKVKPVKPVVFEGKLREDFAKKARERATEKGIILGLLQDSNGNRTYLDLLDKPIRKVHKTFSFYNTVFPLQIEGKEPIPCIVKQLHYNPIREVELRNVILYAYQPGKNIKVDIPVKMVNEDRCPGLRKGGVLNLVMQRITCICNGMTIPPCINLDLTHVEIGHRFVSAFSHSLVVFGPYLSLEKIVKRQFTRTAFSACRVMLKDLTFPEGIEVRLS